MKLIINDDLTIGEIQKNFQEQFPFLNLEFFQAGSATAFPNARQHILDKTEKVGLIRPVHHAGALEFSGEDRVSTIEHLFSDRFGLHVQVSRKSGNNWLLTKQTDEFTLYHQNELGAEMANAVEQAEPEDIHERE